MGFFDKVGSFLKREAKDLGEAAEGAKDKLDQELTRREDELRMTPSEKIAALQQQAAETDAKLDAIADKTTGQAAMADAVAEVGELPADDSLPNITHIVLPDGRVRSGADAGGRSHIVDETGKVQEVPVVEAPTPEELQRAVDESEAAELPAPPDLPASATTGSDETTTAEAVEDVLDDAATDPPPPPAAPATVEATDLPPPPAAPATVEAAEATDLPPPPAPPATVEAAEATDLPPPPAPPVVDTPDEDQLPAEATPAAISTADEATTARAVEEVLEDEPGAEAAAAPPQVQSPPESAAELPPPPAAAASDAVPAVESVEPADDQPVADTPTGDQLPAEAASAVISPTDEATTAHAIDEVLDDDDADPAPQEVAAPVASETEPEPSKPAPAGDDPTKNPSSPDYGKTPAQIKYEQARAAANDLLNELRGELEEEGEI